MSKYNYKQHAFTLVELIVVITILAVLATVAFISFQGFASTSRDSARLSDIANIEKGFNVKTSIGIKLPIPDDKIDITASGTLLTHQGFAGVKTLGLIEVHGGGKDPIDNTYYTYSTNDRRNKYQILGYLENGENISFTQNTYADLNDRFPRLRGSELGIFVNPITKKPIQGSGSNVDVVNTLNEYSGYLDNSPEGQFSGSGSSLIDNWSKSLNPKSCSDILGYFSSEYLENRKYTINPTGSEEIEVFCDMKNGGYTALFSVDPSGITWKYNSTEWINPTIQENDFLTQETTLKSYSQLDTTSIKICRGNLDSCYDIKHNMRIPLQKFYTDDITYIDFSKFEYLNNYPADHHYNNNSSGPKNIHSDLSITYLNILGLTTSIGYLSTPRYSKFGLGINIYERNKLGFQADNNNSWPSFDNFSVGIGGFAPYSNGTTSCIGGYPHPYSEATSIHISGQECYIENLDTVMWYVLGK